MQKESVSIDRGLSAGTLLQHDTLLASPVWTASRPAAFQRDTAVTTQHRIVLCDVPQVAAATLESQIPGSRCTVVPSASAATIAQRYADAALACFETIRGLLRERPVGRCLVQVVAADREQAQMWAGLAGLIETAALENPSVVGQVVLVESDVTSAELAQRLLAERNDARERMVRYHEGARWTRRWQFIDEPPAPADGWCAFKERGVYLITGGLGGLGWLLAKDILARTSGAQIVLAGRSSATGNQRTALESLRQTGRVDYRQADVCDAAQVDGLIASIAKEHGPLNGIVHSAGILRDEFILKKSSAQFLEVLQPKVAGAVHLDAASRTMALDFFVLFSSIASWTGNVGQADYAAANGFMEQFAGVRDRLVSTGERTGRTLAIAWPHWAEGGMNTDDSSMALLEKRTGLRSMGTAQGMAALQHSLATGCSHVMVMHGVAADMRRALASERETPGAAVPVTRSVAPSAQPIATTTGELVAKTREFLRQALSTVLKIPAHRIETRAALENYGIDSILAMKLTSALEATFGTLAKTLFFEYQTLDELADYFVRAHAAPLGALFAPAAGSAAAPPAPPTTVTPATLPVAPSRRGRHRFLPLPVNPQAQRAANEPIAIVGLSGRYPESRNLEAYWRNLRDGADCITEVPKERWDWRQYYSEDRTAPGAHFSKWGGFIDGVDEFDPRFFNIAPREARTIDPQERLFLQHAWMAIEDAGITRAGLQIPNDGGLSGQVGVYAGVMYGEYNVSGSLASIANRVSYFLNLHGPSLTLDTMCSSSLTAMHLACQDLRLGRTQLALAGGVNVSIHPNKYAMLSGGQFISSDGHCQSFGEGGDGYIPGEGVGVAVLKRLVDAERDGNHIYGVIRGSALNHGGKTNGYTVPNPQAQAEVIRRALAEAGVDPRHISYIEAHGTGTKLGDPIELAALTKAFHEGTASKSRDTGFCLIGSAKSNIGHCESAAGIAGVTKVLLQMQHGQIVPSLHSRKLNPHIDFGATPFVVVQTLRAWEPPVVDGQVRPRMAGISSFGAGGANAHLIVEEYRAADTALAAARGPVVVPLSARTAEQLQERARDLLAFIESSEPAPDLQAMAWTLQVGREAMEERAAFVCNSVAELTAMLTAFLNGDMARGGIERAQVKQHKDAIERLTADPNFNIDRELADRGLSKLAELWAQGLELDWRRLAGAVGAPRLMRLPTYPFARERHWQAPVAPAAAVTPPAAAVLHPLVHANTSHLQQQSYVSTFSGSEPFFEGGATLPPRVALEMAQAAVALAASPSDSGGWELQQVEWGEPITAGRIGIALFARGDDAVDVEIHSGDGADERIHGQAHAVLTRRPAPQPALAKEMARAPRSMPVPEHPLEPAAVRLLPSAEMPMQPPTPVKAKATVTLAPLSAMTASPAPMGAESPMARLRDLGDGVFSIEWHGDSLQTAIEPLVDALTRARHEDSLKVLLLSARGTAAWHGGRAACNAAIGQRLFGVVAAFPCPVIAVVKGGATGAGLLLASVCDFLVCDEDSVYGFTDTALPLFPSAGEDGFFRERLGDALADDLLYRTLRGSARQWQGKGWACRTVPSAQVDAQAQQLAAELAGKPRLALELLKTHLSRHLTPRVNAMTAVDPITATPPLADSVLVVNLAADGTDLHALIGQVETAVERAVQAPHIKAIVVASGASGAGGADGRLPDMENAEAAKALLNVVRGSPVPVVAALGSSAHGAAWLFGLGCDAVVYRRDGRYAASALWSSPALAREAAVLCALRLGPSFGAEICFTAGDYGGAELQARVGTLAVADGAGLMSEALRLAAFWSAWPRAALAAWKQEQAALQQRLVDALPLEQASDHDAGDDATLDDATLAATPLALASTVVTATVHPDGVAVVTLHDRVAKNMFSEALVAGLEEAFTRIASTPGIKAVVLTGYDSYFATGGTRETLLAIQQGQARFTDQQMFRRPMDCALPVIAAIQGHGIGGGWSFGMFADLVVLSEESHYLSPYMGYGFTPGAGSTLVLPAKIGCDLARESLLTAQELSGLDLKARGVALPVLPRRDVLPAALALASRMARQPRARLLALKRLWTHTLRASCDETCRLEVAMHEQTFVRNAHTLNAIQAKFSGEPVPATAPAAKRTPELPQAAAIADTLKAMLAQELFIQPQEIDDDTLFIDLGLDSITGVTWIRKINAHYGTAIEATKVYSHPTLQQLSGLVASEAALDAEPAAADAVPQKTGGGSADSVIATLKALLAKELLLPVEEIDEATPFIDLGLDSITGVTWVRKINAHYGTHIEATKVYSHPTLNEMGRLVLDLAQEHSGTLPEREPVTPAAAPAPTARAPAARRALVSWRGQARSEPRAAPAAPTPSHPSAIAVIGMAGQFAQASDVDAFWTHLAEGRNCVGEVPDARWARHAYYRAGAPMPGKTNSQWLGALEAYDQFDPLFFNISPTEAECMDPQQRLFLQACWHGMEDAGYTAQSLSGSQCGVFVGCGPSDYHQASQEQRLSAQGFTGAAASILAARISYFLNLRGPCLSIDTACSSSLVAMANACDSLNAGNCDLALAGGVYVMAGPAMHIMTSQAGMLSTDGRCFSFDHRANGFVPGEGVGVVMLKRLADAQRDDDRILAVIEGWGVNQDGKTNGITAPNEESQTRLLQSVYRKFGIDPAGIQLIEAHGTGTRLGDPIEVAGLKAAFKPFTDKAAYCALGSAKSNIGHCLTAAGAAGFIKLLLALKHRALPPTIHFERLNEHIQLDGSPFYINDRLQPWNVETGERRRAAISSFGFSGTNAHLVIAEPVPRVQRRPAVSVITQDDKLIVPLSARTEPQLRRKAQDLLAHIRKHPSLDLVALAYSLQTGRDAMGERLGLLAGSLDALASQLEAVVAGGNDAADVWRGTVKRHHEGIQLITQDDEVRAAIVDKWLAERKLSWLVDLWVKGLPLDWSRLYGDAKPQRIELPGYPFAKDRFWLTASPGVGNTHTPTQTPEQEQEQAQALPVPPERLAHAPEWTEQPRPAHAAPANPKTVLIVRTAACWGLENAIRAHHARERSCRVVLITLDDETKARSEDEWGCGVDDTEGFRVCLQQIERIDALYFVAANERPTDPASAAAVKECQERNEIQLLRLVKSLKQHRKIGAQVDTYVLTVDNQPIAGGPARCWGAGASGLAYSLAQGNHQFRVRNLDLSAQDLGVVRDLAALVAAIAHEPPSDRGEVFKLHNGKRYRQRFSGLEWDSAAPSAIKHDGVYLIVGGSGLVGQIISRHLIDQYRAQVVWVGRSAEDSAKVQQALRGFGDARDRLHYIEADALSENALRGVLAQIRHKHPRIHGAIFSAMVFSTEHAIDQTTEAAFRAILEVKTLGSQAFYAALRNEPLDFMCFFSSGQAYSFSGAAKLPGYASGITFADGLVRSIPMDGRVPIGTINWGFWKAAVEQRIEKLDGVSTKGIGALEDAEGFACFERFVSELQRGRHNQVLCMRASHEVEILMNGTANRGAVAEAVPRVTPGTLTGQRPQAALADVHRGIVECLSATLKIAVEHIETDLAFSDYGVDSILGVGFVERINARFAIALNLAIIFEYPSVERLSRHVVATCGPQIAQSVVDDAAEPRGDPPADPPAADPGSPEPAVQTQTHRRPGAAAAATSEIAIIGMSGKFPKADDVAQFWRNLVNGVDGVDELPASYLDPASGYSTVKHKGRTRCKWGGILAERDCFDPLFFNISPKEAESMNPHQRLVMQESWNALEDAGYNPKALSGSQTGIFIGAEPAGYNGDSFTGLSDAIIASRLSYTLDFKGPAFVVNTGCSSSAVAVHLACESLRNGESDWVLAGGVNACLHQGILVRLDQIDMLSPSGRCYTFDKAGDGTIISEGVGMLVLKRLDDAVAAGDPIYATICASGMNQDGASNGITAPNGAAQEQLIVHVYDRFGIDPEHISYVEAHGTGTKLGDPVETNALVRAFRRYSAKTGWCAVGSAKSHIGHAAAAAGVIGIIKVLLSMQQRTIPKLLNFNDVNPLIQFSGSPFHIPTATSAWNSPADVPRMAAINSFGHSGTNVHLVVKEHVPRAGQRRAPVAGGDAAIALSAKTAEQLRQKCEALLRFVRTADEPIDLAAMAYTLQVGRESMEERVGFVVDSVDALAQKLHAWVEGNPEIEGVHRGQAKRSSSVVSADGTESASWLLAQWAQGRAIDWSATWLARRRPDRMRLPGYPFAKERYWMASAFGDHSAAASEKVQTADSDAIEDLIDRIADESIGMDEAIQRLTAMV